MRRTIPTLFALAALLAGAAVAEEPRLLDEALEAQQRLVAKRPNNAGAFNDLGNLLELDENLTAAEEAYRRALEINPEFTPALYNLALLLQALGEKKEAKQTLEMVLEIDPAHSWGYFQMGRILETARKYNKAADHYARAFVLDPSLLEIGRNPQILDVRLPTVARAALMSYAERMAKLEAAPREWYNPQRITGLLVPETRAGQAAGAEGAREEAPEDAKQRRLERRQERRQKEAAEAEEEDGGEGGPLDR